MPHRVGLRRHRDVRRRRGLTGVVVATLLLAALPGWADDAPKPVFLVTEIVVDDAVGMPPDAARDVLAARFGRLRDKLEVRSLSEVKSTLDQEALRALLGGDEEQLTDLASYVDVDRLVFGRIFQVGAITEVSVRVFNVREQAMEMAMSRRLPKDKDPSLVLTVVDRLADQLLVWALNSYSDASPSSKYEELKNKKVSMGPKVAPPPPSPWGLLGVSGGTLAGVGAGVLVGGGVMLAMDPKGDLVVPGALLGVGGAALIGGAALVVVDGLE